MPISLPAAEGQRWRHILSHPGTHILLEWEERMANRPVPHSMLSSTTERTLHRQKGEPWNLGWPCVATCQGSLLQDWNIGFEVLIQQDVLKQHVFSYSPKLSRILIRSICTNSCWSISDQYYYCCSATQSCPTLCSPMDAACQASSSFTISQSLLLSAVQSQKMFLNLSASVFHF